MSTCAALYLKCLKHKPEDIDCNLELAMISKTSFSLCAAIYKKCLKFNPVHYN